MKTSESLVKFSPAFLKAQTAITFAAKDATNPHFKSKYADLESVIDAVKKSLNDNGIMFIQSFSPSESGKLSLTTRLMHESGEWIEDTLNMPLQKNDAQGYGSAATYSRRYALAAITGLYQADDDGTEAVKPPPIVYLTVDQITAISDAAKESNITIDAICKTAKVKKISEIESARFTKLIAWINVQKGKENE
jgi:hypothetical protein